MRRTLSLTALTALLLALSAPAALAHDGGEGWWGETDDKVVTNAGFIIIIVVPLLVLVLSLIMYRLDKRKDARKAARARQRVGW